MFCGCKLFSEISLGLFSLKGGLAFCFSCSAVSLSLVFALLMLSMIEEYVLVNLCIVEGPGTVCTHISMSMA